MGERSVKALSIFRRIVSELRSADKHWSRNSQQVQFLRAQMRDHEKTQRILGKAPNEVEHLASCYASYLSSSRQLAELQSRYAGNEKTIEQSANIVGLTLPERRA